MMVVWGGADANNGLSTGGLYDPATDTWTATSTANAPTARHSSTAVWTGSKMIVWGGYGDDGYSDTGGIYDPEADTWTEMSTANAPTGRFDHAVVWTGSRMIVWGGYHDSGLNTGGVYSNPAVLPPTPPLTATDFHTLTPCRVVDTRNAADPTGGPALAGYSIRSFPMTGGVCGIPSTAIALSLNATAVGASASGYLTLFAGDVSDPRRSRTSSSRLA